MMVRVMLILYGNYNVVLLLVMMMMSLVVMMNISAILHHRKDKHSDNFYHCYCCWSKILEMSMFECSYSYFHVKSKKKKEKKRKEKRKEGGKKRREIWALYLYTQSLSFFSTKRNAHRRTQQDTIWESVKHFPGPELTGTQLKKKTSNFLYVQCEL